MDLETFRATVSGCTRLAINVLLGAVLTAVLPVRAATAR
jgi:hypothetical protein